MHWVVRHCLVPMLLYYAGQSPTFISFDDAWTSNSLVFIPGLNVIDPLFIILITADCEKLTSRGILEVLVPDLWDGTISPSSKSLRSLSFLITRKASSRKILCLLQQHLNAIPTQSCALHINQTSSWKNGGGES